MALAKADTQENTAIIEWLERNIKALDPVEAQSVQDFEAKDNVGMGPLSWFMWGSRAKIIPSWESASRDYHLRAAWRNPNNWMVQGAFTGLIKRFISTPFEVKGKHNAGYYQKLFESAQFGEYGGGWAGFWERVWLDYMTLDNGAYIEVIGPGDPMQPLTGRITGIAHLDSLRCQPTGNPEFPVVYWSRKTGEMHRMHRDRVARLVDAPDGDEAYYGRGLSALSRIISVVDAQIKMAQYVSEKLDDLPPAGFMVLSGVTKQQWEDTKNLYEAGRSQEAAQVWSQTMTLLAPDPSIPLDAKMVGFSDAPEHFNYREYVEIHVNALALTLGVDPQDVWPLTGAPLGTGTQSAILHSKARGKMFGSMLTRAERFINFHLLPPNLEFSFKFEDSEADQERANVAKAHTEVAEKLAGLHSKEAALRYLADNVESFRDVLLGQDGELITLTGQDPKAPGQEVVIADSGSPLSAGTDGKIQSDNSEAQAKQPLQFGGQQPTQPTNGQAPPQSPSPTPPPPATQSKPMPKPQDEGKRDKEKMSLVESLLKAQLITLTQAQTIMGQPVDPVLDGMYVVDNSPVPREVMPSLYKVKLGRGVVGFEGIIGGTTNEVPPPEMASLSPQTAAAAQDTSPPSGASVGRRQHNSVSGKQLQSVRLDFEGDFEDTLSAARSGSLDKRRFSTIMRAHINKYGRDAFEEGLKEGGVDGGADDADLGTIAKLVSKQTGYVASLADEVYSESGISDDLAANKPAMWWNKSINPFYTEGLVSADRNGMYEWVYGDTEHCEDCKRLNGQLHRLKDWYNKGWLPQASHLACKGYNCKCTLKKTTGRARGSF